jgi:ribosomal protein L34E
MYGGEIMNAVKMTALVVSLIMISGLLSSCTRTNLRSEERPYGQSYVKETPEQQSRTYREEVKRTPSGEVERIKEEVRETGEKTSREFNQYNRPKNETYSSKEEIHKERKPEHGRT